MCVLYEMLAGKPPFTGTSPRAVLARRFQEPAPSLRAVRPATPGSLEAFVHRTPEADPAQRYSDFPVARRTSPPPAGGGRWRPTTAPALRRWGPLLLLGSALGLGLGLRAAREPAQDRRGIVVAWLSNETGDSALACLGGLAADRLSPALAADPGVQVASAATIIASRLTTGLQVDSLDDPARLHRIALETQAGTVNSGSYFVADSTVGFQAEITDAGTVIGAVGPVTARVRESEVPIDSLTRALVAAMRPGTRAGG